MRNPSAAWRAPEPGWFPFTGIDTPPGLAPQPTNVVVSDGNDATFSLLATNRAPVSYQWRMNNTNLPGAAATSPVYKVLSAGTNNNNEVYTCVVSNPAGVDHQHTRGA